MIFEGKPKTLALSAEAQIKYSVSFVLSRKQNGERVVPYRQLVGKGKTTPS